MKEQIIIIPSYQPSERMVTFVKELSKHFKMIMVVDDGSGITYRPVFKKIEQISNCKVLYHAVNQGKGRALKTAFNECLKKKQVVLNGIITADGDNQHKLEDILRVSDKMDSNPDAIVLGCRSFKDNTIPVRSRLGNNVSKFLYHCLCGVNVSDTQTGLRGIPFQYLGTFCGVEGERYEYETNMLIVAEKNGIRFTEVPIETIYENGNKESHFNPIRDSIKVYLVVFRYCFSSVLAVLIDYTVFAFSIKADLSIFLATYLARLCSALVNFFVNRNVVFKNKGNFVLQFVKYILLVFFSGTASGILITYITEYVSLPITMTKAIVESVLFFVNYCIQKNFIFTNRKEESK